MVSQDFALDPDESRVRAAAHYMVRNLAAGMAMITCREQIINSFTQNLKNTFLGVILVSRRRNLRCILRQPLDFSFFFFIATGMFSQNATAQQKEMVEQAVTACVNDNMDLACAFVQKTTVDKAVVEIDRHLFSVNGSGLELTPESSIDWLTKFLCLYA